MQIKLIVEEMYVIYSQSILCICQQISSLLKKNPNQNTIHYKVCIMQSFPSV